MKVSYTSLKGYGHFYRQRHAVKPKLPIIVPVFKEEKTVSESMASVLRLPVDKALIAVDKGSRDGTYDILKKMADQRPKIGVP